MLSEPKSVHHKRTITKDKIQNLSNRLSIVHQNAQSATNKLDELHPDIFIVSEHSFTLDNVELFIIDSYALATIFQRTHFTGRWQF